MSARDKVKTLLQWCAVNSISIDSRIQVRPQDTAWSDADIGVFSMETYIPPDTTCMSIALSTKSYYAELNVYSVVRIPKEAILSVRSCSLANHIPVVSYGIGAQLSLSLALYVEMYELFGITRCHAKLLSTV